MRIYNLYEGGHALRIAFGILLLAGLLLVGTGIAQIPPGSGSSGGGGGLEIRSEVAQGPFEWDAYNSQAFFYDFNRDGKTERLNVSSITGRTIPAGSLIYDTHTILKDYRVYKEKGILVNGRSSYSILGLQGNMYVAFNDNASKITELLFEQEYTDVKTISGSGSLDMGEGYTLVPDQIDPVNNKVRLNLTKDGIVVDSALVQDQTAWVVNNTIEGEAGPIFVTYVDSVGSNTVNIKYSWLISDNISVVSTGQQYGNGIFTVDDATNSELILKNNIDIDLSKDSTINVTDRLKFKIADDDSIRYYPFVEYTQPGKYEVRGTVFNEPTQGSTIPYWNGWTFGGFYYDFKYNRFTEQLFFTKPLSAYSSNRILAKNELIYSTTKTPIEFKVHEKLGVNVSGAGITAYSIVDWQGEKWIAVKGRANKIARLAFEMGKDDIKILGKGEKWSLGSGYELTVNAMDIAASPKQVWLTLKKDGEVIDQGIGQAPASSSHADREKAVYYKTMTILGESDALLFTVYVNSISSTAVEFKYAWLIDASSAKEIKSGDKFGVFEVRAANWEYIMMDNEDMVSLSRNTEQLLSGGLKLKVADSDQLRLYLKKDIVIPDQTVPPSAHSILINNGDANTDSTLVTIGVFAENATEMSFSNDNSTWSAWEPFSVTKQWTLSGENGLKEVHFKGRNAAGVSSTVNDTIIFAVPEKPFVNKVEIRGSVYSEPYMYWEPDIVKPSWNAATFGAFYYDLKFNRATENLNIVKTLQEIAANSRTIKKDELWYNTTKTLVDFKAYEREGVHVDGSSTYQIVGWFGEKFVGIKGKTNKLARLVLEMGKEDVKTMMVGETWKLGSGYELKVNEVNAHTSPRQVFFDLSKDGILIDNGIVQTPATISVADKEKAVYYKTKTIMGESDALLFSVYVQNIFTGSSSGIVQFKYAWLIDESSAKEIKSADKYGVFEVRSANNDFVSLSNENSVILSKNTETTLVGNLKFRVADDDKLRFYPYVEYTTPGTYEIRGTVYNQTPDAVPMWNARSFPGFYYNLRYNRLTETLIFTSNLSNYASNRSISKNGLIYNTTRMPLNFKVYEKEGIPVNNMLYYSLVGWQGEKWIGINGKVNKLARLVFEMAKEDTKTLAAGDKWALGSGYEMTINTINPGSSPKQVTFTIRKDGVVVDEGTGQAPEGSSLEQKQEALYIKTRNMANESDALFFAIYVDSIFSNATSDIVRFKYAWLIDESSAREIKSGDKFGVFEVRAANPDYIMMANEKPVSLSSNTETTLIGDIKLRIADDSNVLRIYPKVDLTIGGGGIPPVGPVHNINKDTHYTTIQAAIDDASPGDEVHVNSGTYLENVNVTKQLTLRGMGNPVVDARGSGIAIALVADGIVLEGFTAIGGEQGILVSSNNNMLFGNHANSNLGIGIFVLASGNNTLSGNIMSGNKYNFYLAGIMDLDFDNHIDTSNLVDGKPIYYIKDASNAIYDSSSNAGTLYCISCVNVTIKNLNLNKNGVGIFFWKTDDSRIQNINVTNNGHGMFLDFSSNNNTLTGNFVLNNRVGIYLSSSSNNKLYNNYFNNTNNAFDDGNNIWNITRTEGTNIIKGKFVGGNFWSDYTGIDTDGDGLGDTMLPHNSSGGITNGGDYLPLIPVSTSGHGTPHITRFSPDTLTVTNNVGESRTFSITVNQTVNITWLINNTWVQSNSNVIESHYTNNSTAQGIWNITAVAGNDNGTAMLAWDWNVTSMAANHVHNINRDTHYTTIQAAIDDASPGDEIHVHSGTYFENVNVTKQLTLRGMGMPVVDAGGNGSAIKTIADSSTIEGFHARNSGRNLPNSGINVNSNNNNISNNTVSENEFGIVLSGVNNNIISNNTALNNGDAIVLSSSGNNILIANSISNNGFGIIMEYSSSNMIIENNASFNGIGIYLAFSDNNTLNGDTASSNYQDGINLWSSKNNKLSGNTANSNNLYNYGIRLSSSNNNIIYNNYFNNTNNAFDNGNNIWNITRTERSNIINGKFSGGNFWSDYTGIDTDGDGLGDTMLPYNSSGGIANGGDYLPLTSTSAAPVKKLLNPGFELGTTSWLFYTNGIGTFTTTSPGYDGIQAAKIVLNSGGSNIQMYQTGVTLEPDTRYRLSFAAYSTSGHDLSVNLIKHGSPYTSYGLSYTVNLGTRWQAFSTEFTTKGFTETVNDARLMFLLAPFAAAGDTYYVDNVRMEKVEVPGLPVIITHPGDQTTSIGETATFSVVATDTTPLTYQWQKNGVDIPGATNVTYTTQPAVFLDNGTIFRVVVNNLVGSVISNAATLTVRTFINLLNNPGFESGNSPWLFYSNGAGSFGIVSPGFEGNNAARVALSSIGTNIQLYQTGVTLEPNTRYRLSFAAYSTSGLDLSVNLIQHGSPYTNYGLSFTANLDTSWQAFSTEFTTKGFTDTVNDGRLMFWLAPFVTGWETYYIDDVRLERIEEQE